MDGGNLTLPLPKGPSHDGIGTLSGETHEAVQLHRKIWPLLACQHIPARCRWRVSPFVAERSCLFVAGMYSCVTRTKENSLKYHGPFQSQKDISAFNFYAPSHRRALWVSIYDAADDAEDDAQFGETANQIPSPHFASTFNGLNHQLLYSAEIFNRNGPYRI